MRPLAKVRPQTTADTLSPLLLLPSLSPMLWGMRPGLPDRTEWPVFHQHLAPLPQNCLWRWGAPRQLLKMIPCNEQAQCLGG